MFLKVISSHSKRFDGPVPKHYSISTFFLKKVLKGKEDIKATPLQCPLFFQSIVPKSCPLKHCYSMEKNPTGLRYQSGLQEKYKTEKV